MSKKIILCVIAMILVVAAVAVSQTTAAPKNKVVFQLTEAEGQPWKVMILHVQNLQKALAKDGVQVEVVFFGAGLNMVTKKSAAYEDGLKQLADSGVTLAACQNAMKMMNVKSEDLFPFVKEVDSGVAELTRKQNAGWAYIH